MIDQWSGCYDQGWGKNLVSAAYSHPAKVSFKLAERIYAHAIENNWIEKGGLVLDPFGGICGFGFHAMVNGLNFISIELEEKFVKLGQQNIELWNRQLKGWPNLGTARIVQGDSRRLRDVIRGASLIVSSPPYSEIATGAGGLNTKPPKNPNQQSGRNPKSSSQDTNQHYGNTSGNLSNLKEGNFQDAIEKADLVVSSPPFLETQGGGGGIAKTLRGEGNYPLSRQGGKYQGYQNAHRGHTPGNLANMKEGDIDLVVSSPPYIEVNCKKEFSQEFLVGQRKSHPGRSDKALKKMMDKWDGLPESPGQLGSMKEGSFDMCVSSPPYEDIVKTGEGTGATTKNRPNPRSSSQAYYSKSDKNLGNSSGDTFWSASKEIVQGCYDLLKPNGHAIWVTKRYVKAGKIVEFSDRWLALCESVGFKLVCRHQALLVKEHGTQTTIHGDEKITTERKSFFRRLAESKGSPRIDFEDVLCLIK